MDSLVALLERLYAVLDQYAPVLLHYPGVCDPCISFFLNVYVNLVIFCCNLSKEGWGL